MLNGGRVYLSFQRCNYSRGALISSYSCVHLVQSFCIMQKPIHLGQQYTLTVQSINLLASVPSGWYPRNIKSMSKKCAGRIFYISNNAHIKQHKFGVGLVLGERLLRRVPPFTLVDDHLTIMSIEAKCFDTSVLWPQDGQCDQGCLL